MTCGLTAAEFWDSTIAQLCALVPPDAPTSVEPGTTDDLAALAAASKRR